MTLHFSSCIGQFRVLVTMLSFGSPRCHNQLKLHWKLRAPSCKKLLILLSWNENQKKPADRNQNKKVFLAFVRIFTKVILWIKKVSSGTDLQQVFQEHQSVRIYGLILNIPVEFLSLAHFSREQKYFPNGWWQNPSCNLKMTGKKS